MLYILRTSITVYTMHCTARLATVAPIMEETGRIRDDGSMKLFQYYGKDALIILNRNSIIDFQTSIRRYLLSCYY